MATNYVFLKHRNSLVGWSSDSRSQGTGFDSRLVQVTFWSLFGHVGVTFSKFVGHVGMCLGSVFGNAWMGLGGFRKNVNISKIYRKIKVLGFGRE